MALQPVDISSGQVSGVDDLSPAASSVVNWEIDESGISRPRAGLVTHTVANASTNPSIGLARWKTYIVNVTSDRYVRVLSEAAPTNFQVVSTATATTQLGGVAPRATFAVGDLYTYIAGGGQILRWQPSTANPETLAASPLNCTHVSILGQRLIGNDTSEPNSLFWSDIGEVAFTSWPSANETSSDARPDPIVAHYENTNELFVWGSETLQVYAVGADPTLPFDQVTTMNVGLSAPYSPCRLESQFAFLDDRRRIVISDGRQAEPISAAIEKTIRNFATVSDCWIYREERGQQSLLVVRFPTEKRTFVRDLKGEKWSERYYYVAPFQTDFPVCAHVYWPRYNYQMLASSLATAGLMRMSEDARQDLSGPLVCERITGWHDFGTLKRKRSNRIRAIMRRGTAAQNATPGSLEIRVQNDDSTWTPWQFVSVGAPEDYKQYQDVFATNGIFRRRRYHYRYSTTEDHSLVSLHDDVTELAA